MDEDETVELETDEPEVVENEDGSAVIRTAEEDHAGDPFYANLALTLPETELDALAGKLLELVERDRTSRKLRDEQQEEGFRRTGLGNDAPGGAQFAGASRVVHPMLTEACIDFSARAGRELFPPQGPAKSFVLGTPTEAKQALAERKTALMNWQLTIQCPEIRTEFEQMLTQLPMGGSQYIKMWWDDRRKRPTAQFVPIDDVFLPYAATNFYTAWRKTHRQYLTRADYDERVGTGMYRDVDIVAVGIDPDQSSSARANDRIEGREQTGFNDDGLREVLEIAVTMETSAEQGAAPWLVTIDKTSRKVLALYRNWSEADPGRSELEHMIEFGFIPWRGVYAIGLPHIIGGLSGAATGALRALLDSAHIANSATMLKLKSPVGGQSASVEPGQTAEIEGGVMVDDIRKLAMPMPFNQPSQVLFELLSFVVEAGKGVVRTTLEDIASDNTEVPVGTTMARIEQGMVVYRAIHGRAHASMQRLLMLLHRLNRDNLDDEAVVSETGERLASRADFAGPLDAVPVSDPNIFTESQRFAQMQAVSQRADAKPDLYDARKVEQRLLAMLKIPDPDDLLLPSMEPGEDNAVRENVLASVGKQLVAMPRQDHVAHLRAHVGYMTSPLYGMSPVMAPGLLPVLIAHVQQHMAMWYQQAVYEVVGAVSGLDADRQRRKLSGDEQRRAFDRMLAEAAAVALEQAPEVFAGIPEAIQQAQAFLAQVQGPAQTPVDPAAVAMADVQRRAEKDKADTALDQAELQRKALADRSKADIAAGKDRTVIEAERLRQRGEDERLNRELAVKVMNNEADNETAVEISDARDEGDDLPGFG